MILKEWYDDYKNLDLLQGKIEFILEDGQDMIEIHYKDGMLIDVGYVEEDKKYYITVVESDDIEGWANPLAEFEVNSKDSLFNGIQEVVLKFRK